MLPPMLLMGAPPEPVPPAPGPEPPAAMLMPPLPTEEPPLPTTEEPPLDASEPPAPPRAGVLEVPPELVVLPVLLVTGSTGPELQAARQSTEAAEKSGGRCFDQE